MIAKALFYTAILLALATPAQASCKDDLADLKPRIDHLKSQNLQRYYLATKWWGRALEAEPGSETECDSYLARARKALTDPLPVAAACAGPNAYAPACQDGGRARGGGGGAMPFGDMDLGGGGGRGGVAPVAPVAPVTSTGALPFTPPGSVGSPASSSR
jgi:hypothetical protein